MIDTKDLRSAVYSLISAALSNQGITGFSVAYGKEKTGASKYCVFILDALAAQDDKTPYELEINCVGPDSAETAVETAADAITATFDCCVQHKTNFSFYSYKNTRNTVDGSDPHTVRVRMTFDLYLYDWS